MKLIQIASTEAWLWVAAIEPVHRMVLGVIYVHDTGISMLVAEIFLKSLIKLMESIYILSILTMDHFMIP